MCHYIPKEQLKEPKRVFDNWFRKVQKYIRKQYKIHTELRQIGSGSRNMVIKQCNRDYFDLDYEIVIVSIPNFLDWDKDAKDIKDIFRKSFDEYKPSGFTNCEDSTQALTTKNKSKGYSFDVIITTYTDSAMYILYNKKNTNGANNNDYMWAKRPDLKNHHENFSKISGEEWGALREIYRSKKHSHKDDVEPNKKKSYQLLNESVNEILRLRKAR